MLGFMEVFGGVFVFGRITTTDVATDQAHAQVDPSVADFYAILAFPFIGLPEFDLLEMRALLWHGSSGDYPLAK